MSLNKKYLLFKNLVVLMKGDKWLYFNFDKHPDYWVLYISKFCISNNAIKLHENWNRNENNKSD